MYYRFMTRGTWSTVLHLRFIFRFPVFRWCTQLLSSLILLTCCLPVRIPFAHCHQRLTLIIDLRFSAQSRRLPHRVIFHLQSIRTHVPRETLKPQLHIYKSVSALVNSMHVDKTVKPQWQIALSYRSQQNRGSPGCNIMTSALCTRD